MRITVFDKALQKKAIFFHCLSIFWETRYFGKSSFCIEFGAEELTDVSIDVMDYVTSDIDETVMLVTSVVYKKQHVTVSGFSADYILHFRVNPLELAGGKAEALIRSLVADMASWDHLSLDDAAGITDTYNGLLLPGTVLDAVQVISQGCDIGIRVRKKGDSLKFGCYKPGGQVISRLPEGYTELSYIESTGTQYVDTGFKPNQDTRVVADFECFSGSVHPQVFGASGSSYANSLMFLGYKDLSKFLSYYNGTRIDYTADISGRHVIDANKNIFTLDGDYTIASYTIATFTSTQNMFLFAYNNNGSAANLGKTRIYSCQIYDNGIVVRDFIPCINESEKIGLYDAVNGVFYGNAGTGEFVAGDTIQSETEYTEVTGYFASPLGNMGDESYTVSDQNFANVALVKGGGGVSVKAGDTSASGAERRELFVDASSETQGEGETAAAYQERLRQIGLAALAERARIALSEFVLDDDTVKVGDLVRVKPSYIPGTITARITSIAYKSQNNTIKRTVGVGTPIRRS